MFKKNFVLACSLTAAFFIFGLISANPVSAQTQANPVVSMVYPVGGETFTVGQKITIKWNQANVDQITIGYKSCESCLDWISFSQKANISDTAGSYDWTIPEHLSTGSNYQIELIAYHTGIGQAIVDSGKFTINGNNPVPASNAQTTSITQTNTTQTSSQAAISTDAYKAVVKVKTYHLNKNYALEESAEGSGVIISTSGLILTNDHVVSERSQINDIEYDTAFQICLTKDVSEKPSCDYLAKLIASNKDIDIALLQIVNIPGKSEMISFPFLKLSQTDNTVINDEVTAIGYPAIGGDTITITKGIISGKMDKYNNNWIKTDAVISFGSSGGAAINSKNEVVGISTQVHSDVSGELGYLLASNSLYNWVGAKMSGSPKNNKLFDRLMALTKKQKILENSNMFINLYPYETLNKPGDWEFSHAAEDALSISRKNDQDSGKVVWHLVKSANTTDMNDIKPALIEYFGETGSASVIKYNKDKAVKVNNIQGKLVTLSVKGTLLNSYVFPHKEYLAWIEYNNGKNDKDKKVVEGIINSFKITNAGPKFVEIHKYSNTTPKFSISTGSDWPILKQDTLVQPAIIHYKKTKEAFVYFQVEKIDDSIKELTDKEYIESKKEEIDSINQMGDILDLKYQFVKSGTGTKLNNEIKNALYVDGIELIASQNKAYAYDRDYYIRTGDYIITINLTVYTDKKAVFDKTLAEFNKMLTTFSLKK